MKVTQVHHHKKSLPLSSSYWCRVMMVIMMISENVHPSSLQLPAYPSIQIGILLTQGGCWLAGWLAMFRNRQSKIT